MPPRQREISVIAVPAGEHQPPGWFALHPSQFGSDAERQGAYGHWHRISGKGGHIFRALQFDESLPQNGIALDWTARATLEQGRGRAIADSAPMQLQLRKARLVEYPRCLWQHPSPSVRLATICGLSVVLLCVVMVVWGYLPSGISDHNPKPEHHQAAVAAASDRESFIASFVGEWHGPETSLLIRRDNGVIGALRQSRTGNETQIDFYAAAPLRFDADAQWLELDTPEGIWRLSWVPAAGKSRLRVTYPGNQQVIYD